MEGYGIIDRASSMFLVGLTCVFMSANTSVGTGFTDNSEAAYYVNTAASEFCNVSTVLAEYLVTDDKLKVEMEAQKLFGKMREATFEER